MGNQQNRLMDGLTVLGQLAIGAPGNGNFAVLQTDGSGNLFVNGIQVVGGGGGATGSAGGVLAGTYPNPTFAAGAVGLADVSAAIKDAAAGTASLRTLGTGATQAAAGNHQHSGTDITSGIVGASFLGTGTPSSGNFLRGDGTWTAVGSTSRKGASITVASSAAIGTWNADRTCSGSADNTTIQSAIGDLGGAPGRVLLSEGVFNMNNGITLDTGQVLEGQGPGTILDLTGWVGGSNTGVITLASVNSHAIQVKNLTIRCTSRGTNVDCIYLNNNGGSFSGGAFSTSPDAEHLLENLLLLAPSGCGIRIAGGATDAETAATTTSSTITSSSGNARGTWINNVFCFYPGRNGLFMHAPDSFVHGFVVGSSGRSGIVSRGANVRYTACKSYYSTWHGVVMDGNRNEWGMIEAQDNCINGFLITGDQITASGLCADSNGGNINVSSVGDGFYINGNYCNIEGVTFDRNATALSRQRYGVTFGGTGVKNNITLTIDNTRFSGAAPNTFSGSPTGQLNVLLATNGTAVSGDDLTQARFGAGRLYFNTPTTVTADANLGNSDVSIYLDETLSASSRYKLKARAKTSGGTPFTADLTRADTWNFSDEIVTPGGMPLYLVNTNVTAIAVAGTVYASRFRAPKTGTITGIYVWVGTASGNVRGGIYTTGLTASLSYDSGNIAVVTNNAWTRIGTPSVAVNEGDYFDVCLVADNTTLTVGRTAGAAFAHGNVNNLHSDFTALAATGGNTKLNWAWTAGAFAALGATATDGNRVVSNDDISFLAKIV